MMGRNNWNFGVKIPEFKFQGERRLLKIPNHDVMSFLHQLGENCRVDGGVQEAVCFSWKSYNFGTRFGLKSQTF